MEDIAKKALAVLKGGGIIIYPTDTAMGIGCRMDDRRAVDRLFRLRRRPLTQPTPVLVGSSRMALAYLDHPSDIVRRFIRIYWPGALTIVGLCKKEFVYSPIRGGGGTVGLRQPNHKLILTIISKLGVPVLGPSANFHGERTPFGSSDLDPDLVKLVDFVVPGQCPIGNVSTVVDCSITPYTLLRQGAVIVG